MPPITDDPPAAPKGALWRAIVERVPSQVWTDAQLNVYYRTSDGAWYELQHTSSSDRIARRLPNEPAMAMEPGYAVSRGLHEACCGLEGFAEAKNAQDRQVRME